MSDHDHEHGPDCGCGHDHSHDRDHELPRWPTFQTKTPRILLLTSRYFLLGEVTAACERLDIPHHLLDLQTREMEMEVFVGKVLHALTTFKPDFVLTVNHLGVDHEGVLAQILQRMDLPLVSWFVDNPHLILPLYPKAHQDRTLLLTWDADNVDSLRAFGYPNVAHLPLGVDHTRFTPGRPGREEWKADVSFVGNSMAAKTEARRKAADPGPELSARLGEVARAFGDSEEPSAARFLLANYPELRPGFMELASPGRMLAFETLLTWQSTLDYRLDCIRCLMPFKPLVVGDPGWIILMPGPGWRHLPELGYYEDLPGFYPRSAINFNATSRQMKGAVNQRVFDVPACGGFLITDHRRQMEELFEPGREVIVYEHPDEIQGLVERWLTDESGRRAVTEAARKRILAEHTYDHRIQALADLARQTFA